jgi:selenocysteine lyase/cysteine desulfurase
LHESVSAGAAVVASALDYHHRPRVVTTNLDFPTIAYQWLSRERAGVELVVVDSPDGLTVPPELIANAIDERTALVATSHVYFTTGAEQDISAVARAAHRYGALAYIDGYQAAGQVPVDVHASGVDFYAAGGLKWLLGGPGIAFLYVRRELHVLEPTVTGWFAHAHPFTFDVRQHDRLGDARRFELGTPALAAVHAQLGALRLLAEIGPGQVIRRTRELQAQLITGARARGLAPRVSDRQTAIITFPDPDPTAAVARLAERGVVVDARPGHVRVSPFFYNSDDAIQTFLEAY